MKLISFRRSPTDRLCFGALLANEQKVLDLTHEAAGIPQPANHLGWFDLAASSLHEALSLLGRLTERPAQGERLEAAGAICSRNATQLEAPVPRPGKVICIGLNYRDHAAESGMELPTRPLMFSKFPTSITAPDSPVRIPPGSREVDYEAELAVIIGKCASRVSVAAAMDHVLGYSNFNDVSARDFQFKDGQWQRGKSCDTFAPFGEYIATTDEIPDPHKLAIGLRLNGEALQGSNTDQLIFGVPELIAALSESVTLEPGDVIATGTPPGVGFARKPPIYLRDGDQMEVEIEGLGILRNPVTSD